MEKDAKRLGEGLRNVIALGFVSFFTDISSEMVLGILPLFVLDELGATRAVLGLIEGLGESVSYIFRMLSGTISDKLRKRKVIVFIGYAFSTAAKPFFAISRFWTEALTIRVSDRIGKGIRTAPRDALLSVSVPEREMGRAFGLHRTLDQLGAIIGPTLAFLLMGLIGMRAVFWISFIPGLIALILLIFLVKEAHVEGTKGGLVVNFREVLHREYVMLLSIIIVFSVGAFNFSFILLKSNELGIPEGFIPLIYALINIAHTAMGIPSGVLSDKIGRERVLMMGYGFYFLTSVLCMTSMGTPLYALVIALIYGIYVGTAETVQRALIPRYAPTNLRGTAYGIYYLAIGLSFLLANPTIGYLWDTFGSSVAFTYSAITSGVAIIGMIAFHKAGRLGKLKGAV